MADDKPWWKKAADFVSDGWTAMTQGKGAVIEEKLAAVDPRAAAFRAKLDEPQQETFDKIITSPDVRAKLEAAAPQGGAPNPGMEQLMVAMDNTTPSQANAMMKMAANMPPEKAAEMMTSLSESAEPAPPVDPDVSLIGLVVRNDASFNALMESTPAFNEAVYSRLGSEQQTKLREMAADPAMQDQLMGMLAPAEGGDGASMQERLDMVKGIEPGLLNTAVDTMYADRENAPQMMADLMATNPEEGMMGAAGALFPGMKDMMGMFGDMKQGFEGIKNNLMNGLMGILAPIMQALAGFIGPLMQSLGDMFKGGDMLKMSGGPNGGTGIMQGISNMLGVDLAAHNVDPKNGEVQAADARRLEEERVRMAQATDPTLQASRPGGPAAPAPSGQV